MSWQLNVAAVQMRSIGDLAANLEVCRKLVGDAAAGGAKLVVLPECFSFLGAREGEKMVAAEVLDGSGPVLTALAELCRKHGIWIIGGGTPETVAGDPKRAFNTCVVVDPTGKLVTRYRKIHLFDVDIPGGATLRESDGTVAGEDLEVVHIDPGAQSESGPLHSGGVPVGLSICYDLRFPELYRKLTQDLGAQVIVIPAAFTAHTGAAHWHVLMRARAIENQVWIVAAAQWGKHNEKRESYGHSLIVDPWGTIVGERVEGDGVVAHGLTGAEVEKRRVQMPCGRHAVLWKP